MAFEVVVTGASRIAVIRIVNPPVNAVSAPVRRMLVEAFEAVEADDTIKAVVLCGAGRHFASGIPLGEVDRGIELPSLGEVCQRIEMASKPVVALMDGHVAAAGLEIALAAHARVTTEVAKLGMPDFRLGLSPGGGATQRLPRLIGAGGALEMLLEAEPHFAPSSICAPLIDRLVKGSAAMEDALRLAAELAETGQWVRTRDRHDGLGDPITFQRHVKSWRDRFADVRDDTVTRIIEAVEAAQLLPFEAGLAMESACFQDLLQSPRSKGLRRSRHAEQQSNRLTAVPGPQISRIAVMGQASGMIRTGGAALFSGAHVVMYDPDPACAAQARDDLLARSRTALAARGASAISAAADRLSAARAPSDLASAQVIFLTQTASAEKLTEDLTRIADHVAADAVILCQTELPDVPSLAPARLLGRVFGLAMADRNFPARAAEVSAPEDALRPALATAQAALWRLNRLVLRGVAGRSMMTPALFDTIMSAADALVRHGVAPSRIEKVMLAHGFARGPYGLLLQASSAAYLTRTLSRRSRMGLSHRILAEGIAPMSEGRTSLTLDYVATEMVEVGGTPPDDAMVIGAMTAALANTGCRLLAEGAAFRPMLIDALMLHGFGYPRAQGGPMAEADMTGLANVLDRCRRFENLDAQVWTPHPMLRDFVTNGLNFLDLDQSDPGVRAA
ncbi:enoyl-CoA hydratase-related protein [Pseudooceanicola onchidii]|uniref:enoyl-CoA hydratase-related protein n=1 Tax=Pseudooceanicola onchidii TaxID=2562279 RepID=UPI0010A9D3AD|nr:enoyl-CoA hydratase-related protein [Pseudooceanicola onchidii]